MNQKVAKKNPKVDAFISRATQWQPEFEAMRKILLACPVSEELKWGKPCYAFEQNNLVIVQGFKAFCALLFPKGALLKDPDGLLEKPGENTQSARRISFTDAKDILRLEATLKAYIEDAIQVEKAGLKVDFKETEDYPIPEELQDKLDEDPAFKAAFEALTPGRQRGYLLHFSSAKQSKTRVARIEKCTPRIFDGIGFNERG